MEVADDSSSKGVGGEKRGKDGKAADGNKKPKIAKVSLLTTCLLVYLFIPSFLYSFIFD
jgi:hypothetical protein